MKNKFIFYKISVLLLVSAVLSTVSPGCGKDQFSRFKGEEYENAWKQVNTFVVESKDETFSLRDIKKDYLVKAAIFELVRRAENPGKKSSVDTMSKSEENRILSRWKEILDDMDWEHLFYNHFSENMELAAQLLIHNKASKEEAYNQVSRYIFQDLKKFDEAIALNEKSGKTTQQACNVILNDFKTSGVSAYYFFENHEDEYIAFLQKAGNSKEEAREMIASDIAYHFARNVELKEPSEEEAEKNLKEAEKRVLKYLGDEKETAKMMGEACLRFYLPFKAYEYLKDIGDEEIMKKVYYYMAGEYSQRSDFKNAAIYFEKAGEKEMAEAARKRM